MKILFITSSLEPNDGWGRHSNDLIREISKSNEVFVASNSQYKIDNIQLLPVLYSPLSAANPVKIFIASRKVQKIIDSFHPEVIHFLAEPYVLFLPFLKLNKNIKILLTVHGTYSFVPLRFKNEEIKLWITSLLAKKAYKILKGIISVSSFTKQYLLTQYQSFYEESFDQNKITVISNGIDLSKISFDLNQKINNEKKTVLFVGAIKKRKGVMEAIDALAQYKDRYGKDFVFNIAGSYNENDPYFKKIMERVHEFGLTDSIVFLGFVDDEELKMLYSQADLYLMLSIQDEGAFEGFGLVYLEAGVYGTPSIGSRDSGASDAIQDGVTGYLVTPNDPSFVAEKIHSILDNHSIKPSDCISWVKEQDIREKAKLVMSCYKK